MRQTSSQIIYNIIKDDIIYLRRKPGEELNIKTLSEEMEVSRSPVRDALMILQNEALVDMIPQRGCWVSLINLDRVDEERLLRLTLERCVCEHLSGKLKKSDIAKIQYCIQVQRESLEKGDMQNFYAYDDEMHHVYFKASGLENFWNLWIRETGNYRRVRLLSFDAEGSAESNIQQHEELLDAFEREDFKRAYDILSEHIMKLDYEKNEIIKHHSDYFLR